MHFPVCFGVITNKIRTNFQLHLYIQYVLVTSSSITSAFSLLSFLPIAFSTIQQMLMKHYKATQEKSALSQKPFIFILSKHIVILLF